MEKGPDLYDLVGQYLRRLDVGDITDAKVRYLISRGRVALLLDGFDELVQRVSYPTAASYLSVLLEAATGDAKIVLTSRAQHFADDSQVRDALLTTTGRDACRILALASRSKRCPVQRLPGPRLLGPGGWLVQRLPGRSGPARPRCDDVEVATGNDTPNERPASPDLVDPHDLSLLETTLALSVDERVRRLINYVRFVEAGRAALRAALRDPQ